MIASPGPFWSGAERVQMVAEARAAMHCDLCRRRLEALSPFAVQGSHDTASDLPAALIDMIHRLRTDPARYTRSVFAGVLAAGIPSERYIEAVSVVNAAVVVDTMHASLGLPLPDLPAPEPGEPTGQPTPDVVDDGAWVPITRVSDRNVSDTGLPGRTEHRPLDGLGACRRAALLHRVPRPLRLARHPARGVAAPGGVHRLPRLRPQRVFLLNHLAHHAAPGRAASERTGTST